MKMLRRLKTNSERGATLVEMAIVFPIVLMITFAIIEYAYYYEARHQLEAAAQAGVEHAIKLPDLVNDNSALASAKLDDVRAEVSRAVLSRLGEGPLSSADGGAILVQPLSVARCVSASCSKDRLAFDAVALRAGEYALGTVEEFTFVHPTICSPDVNTPCPLGEDYRLDPGLSYTNVLRDNPVVVVVRARVRPLFHMPGLPEIPIVASAFAYPQRFALPPSGQAVQCSLTNSSDSTKCSAYCASAANPYWNLKCCAGCPSQPGAPYLCKGCCGSAEMDACGKFCQDASQSPSGRPRCYGNCTTVGGTFVAARDCSCYECCQASEYSACSTYCADPAQHGGESLCSTGCSIPNGKFDPPTSCGCTQCGCTAAQKDACQAYCNGKTSPLGYKMCSATCKPPSAGGYDPSDPSQCSCTPCSCSTMEDKNRCMSTCAVSGQCCNFGRCGECGGCAGTGS